MSFAVKPIAVIPLIIFVHLIDRFKSDHNSIESGDDIIPYGTRLSSKNRIIYKNLGNFQLKIHPKPVRRVVEPITLPVHRIVHPVQYVDAEPNYAEPRQPAVVEVQASSPEERPPLMLNFRSISSDMRVSHHHVPARPQFVHTQSSDEPQIVIKQVNIPVIQEIFEYIAPKRYYTREIRPVIEIQNRLIAHNSYASPIDMSPEESNEIADKRSECIQLDETNPNYKHFYSGHTPYDMRYNSSRSYMSYYKSNNKLFNIMRKYRD